MSEQMNDNDGDHVNGVDTETTSTTTTTTTTSTSNNGSISGSLKNSPIIASIIPEDEEDIDMDLNKDDDDDDDVEAPLPFNDDDDDDQQVTASSQNETEEERKKRLETIALEKERLKKIKEEQRKQMAEIQKRQREELMADKEKSQKDRLKFLLERTELYTHFVSNSTKSKKPTDVQSTPTKRGRITEQEEDDEIMKETIEEEVPHSFNFFTSNPPYIKHGQMRDYQIYGLNWLIHLYERGINGILADEMGLGKTLQTISFLGYLAEYKGIRGPHLIIAPKSTLSGWTKEFRNWCPSIRVVKFHGNQEERAAIKRDQLVFKKFDVCVTTYEMAIKEKAAFRRFSWRYVIIDEAHRIKNENSLLSQRVRLFHSQFRLLITGTPLQNNLHELWALLNFLLPDVFSSSDDFDRWFDLENSDNQQEVIDRLHKVLRPFLLRRIKTEVEKSLPPKKEIKLFVGMSTMQRDWYKRLISKDFEALAGGAKGSGGRVRLLNIVMQLRKCCNHPYLFDGAEEEPYTTGDHLIKNCGKMVLLDKLLSRMKQRGSRVLIFSQMARMVDILEDYMNYRNYKYCRIDGNTESQARESQIDDFNAPKSKYFVFLLTTRAGGLGITLNTADVVILYDSDWNPQVDLQAQDRAHRIGQTKPVTVYRFVTENAMEEKMVERAEMKLQLDAAVIQQGRLVEQSKGANSDELLSMIRFGADDIFKFKDSTITDEDIDTILHKGEEKTKQINERAKDLATNPIKLNLTGNLYEFDGVDYKALHHTHAWTGDSFKRERRQIDPELGAAQVRREVKKKVKAPKQPTIHDFQFYPARLTKLFEKETEAYIKKQEYYENKIVNITSSSSHINTSNNNNATVEEVEPDFGELTEEEKEDREKMLKMGMSTWDRNDFRSFVRGCELYGRKAYENITETVETKTLAEVREYSTVFWKRCKELADYDKILARVTKGEERLAKHQDTIDSLNRKVTKYKSPWQQLKINYGNAKKSKYFTAEDDVYLVIMLHRVGYGAWDELHEEICRAHQYRFNWVMQTRTSVELKTRCDLLIKYIQKEQQEEDEKKREKERLQKEKEKEAKKLTSPKAKSATSPKITSPKVSKTATTKPKASVAAPAKPKAKPKPKPKAAPAAAAASPNKSVKRKAETTEAPKKKAK
ncbi:hypothetical protein SAMD00019534_022120 [Acytostelium subglobosum LB1]|uniref:hypothetical protein n=1 Tax=Acytostelium subglobosum LB1 TaxID=1410327 RepID=UPI000644B7A7|nr:hypothetical protein SAMD00019534_022120 [Acytostelium subglobosum LB1]GAM19037.1 hypothetical protein SAMD00019534_022120 [Acytostelium subglobosum LB1]|eukprot:XP_012756964.1 hypothetical protein SAMD00019534_022120 [Acytostelium subglobosum LB1]